MCCIAVPDAPFRGDPRFSAADCVLSSLAEVTPQLLSALG
jgi:hypothetical protein